MARPGSGGCCRTRGNPPGPPCAAPCGHNGPPSPPCVRVALNGLLSGAVPRLSLLSCPHKAGSSGRAASQWKVLSPETARERPRRPDSRRGRHACAALRCAAPRCAAGRPPLALGPHPGPRPRAEKKFEGTRAHRIQRAFLKCLLCAERGAARRGGAGRPPFGQLSSARCHRRGTGSRASRRRRAGLHAFGGAVGGAGRWARGLSADGALERRAVLTCLRQ